MTAAAAPRVATSQHRYAFVLLGSVQVTLIFMLAATTGKTHSIK